MRYRLLKRVAVAIWFSLLTSFFSCEDLLQTEAPSSISDESFWLTNDDFEVGLFAAYDALQESLRDNYWLWGELRADNFGPTGRQDAQTDQLLNNGLDGIASSSDWGSLYKVIQITNNIIDRSKGADQIDNNLIGEAYALRALSYFYGVRIWGDMPLHEKAITRFEEVKALARTSASQIMDNVIKRDLIEAEKLISSTSSNHRRFNLGGILALKAHVLAWSGENAEALIEIDKLEALDKYELVTTREEWSNMFIEESSPELIFSLSFDPTDPGRAQSNLNDGSPTYIYSKIIYDKWREEYPTDSLRWVNKINSVDPDSAERTEYGDWRFFESLYTSSVAPSVLGEIYDTTTQRVTTKFLKSQIGEDDGRNNDGADYPIFRYAGIVLLKAELLLKEIRRPEAEAEYNKLRRARNLPLFEITPPAVVSTRELAKMILDERQFELFGEGHRWFDLRRNKMQDTDATEKSAAIVVMKPFNGLNDEGELLWPVSTRAIQRNKELLQNDAYI